jgi:hypothetical protein
MIGRDWQSFCFGRRESTGKDAEMGPIRWANANTTEMIQVLEGKLVRRFNVQRSTVNGEYQGSPPVRFVLT